MSAVLESNQTTQTVLYPRRKEEIFYPESHEDDMGESTTHYDLISDLIKALKIFFANQTKVFIAANLNIYYEQGSPRKWHAPDVMIAFGVPNQNRKVYKLWQEKQFPQVIFEVASDTTWKTDISDKVEDYGRLGVEEYYLLDPENAYLPLPLMAYRRDETGRLRLVLTENNRVLSPRLNLEIVWENERFRLFDPTNQEFLLTTEELQAELEKLRKQLN